MLRVDEAGLHGIVHPDPIGLADLVGREELRADLLADLAAFTSGEPANDALLYGRPGTGKSATVRACAAEFADRGLRLIQVAHDELEHIDAVFEAVAGAGPWCLLFLDDLVFDDASRADRALRAALEGGVVARPRNVLVWATSNRLNMTHMTHSERADEIDEVEARGEKMALANRFGRRVRFDLRGEDWYLEIALRLVRAGSGACRRAPRRRRCATAAPAPAPRPAPPTTSRRSTGHDGERTPSGAAAEAAVAAEVRSGMALGLGTGSTAELRHDRRRPAARSGRAERRRRGADVGGHGGAGARARRAPGDARRAAAAGGLHRRGRRDRPELGLIKGLGGALLREKIVASAADRFVVVGDDSKRVARLRREGAGAGRGDPVRRRRLRPRAGRARVRSGAARRAS